MFSLVFSEFTAPAVNVILSVHDTVATTVRPTIVVFVFAFTTHKRSTMNRSRTAPHLNSAWHKLAITVVGLAYFIFASHNLTPVKMGPLLTP
jgi:hypothetical protein